MGKMKKQRMLYLDAESYEKVKNDYGNVSSLVSSFLMDLAEKETLSNLSEKEEKIQKITKQIKDKEREINELEKNISTLRARKNKLLSEISDAGENFMIERINSEDYKTENFEDPTGEYKKVRFVETPDAFLCSDCSSKIDIEDVAFLNTEENKLYCSECREKTFKETDATDLLRLYLVRDLEEYNGT